MCNQRQRPVATPVVEQIPEGRAIVFQLPLQAARCDPKAACDIVERADAEFHLTGNFDTHFVNRTDFDLNPGVTQVAFNKRVVGHVRTLDRAIENGAVKTHRVVVGVIDYRASEMPLHGRRGSGLALAELDLDQVHPAASHGIKNHLALCKQQFGKRVRCGRIVAHIDHQRHDVGSVGFIESRDDNIGVNDQIADNLVDSAPYIALHSGDQRNWTKDIDMLVLGHSQPDIGQIPRFCAIFDQPAKRIVVNVSIRATQSHRIYVCSLEEGLQQRSTHRRDLLEPDQLARPRKVSAHRSSQRRRIIGKQRHPGNVRCDHLDSGRKEPAQALAK